MKTVNPSTMLRINGERSRTIKFYTLGCKVNQYDTQSIRERFLSRGFKEVNDGNPADIYVINTCTVTQRADSESFGLIRRARRENPFAKVIVTGCLAENDIHTLSSFNEVDLVIRKSFFPEGISNFSGHTRAFLKIQDGCNNFCSYCKVPLVRGTSRSKLLDKIVQEAQRLVRSGFKEIVLSGICLGNYGKDLQAETSLADVICELEKIKGLLRIRFSSIEAGDVTDSLINRMAESKKFCRHLHIPIQSGDDEILKKMNRRYSRDGYLNLIKKIRSQIPGIAITTDVLVGFPTEDGVNFENTLDLIKETEPLKVHIFPYSKREGTKAFNFKIEVKPAIIKQRISRLKSIAYVCAVNYKKQFINKEMDVLIEQRLKENPLFWEGHTDNYIKVLVKSKRDLKNQLIPIRIKRINNSSVIGDFG